MSTLPKLRVFSPFNSREEVYELERAKDFLFRSNDIVMHVVVEGRLIHTYEELVRLASQDSCKGKEYLEVRWVPLIPGGG